MPERIRSRIVVDRVSGCWLGQCNIDRDGYSRLGGEGLHRVVWRLLAGPIPDGLVLDHVAAAGCLYRACCWPAHLEPVTRLENTMRGNSPPALNARKTRCGSCGAELDLFNTYWTPDGRRDCRACIRRRVAEYKDRQRDMRLAA